MRIRHGGDLRRFSERFGIPEHEILDFSSNINPEGPPASVKEVYEKSFDEIRSYPDSEALEFRREVARHYPLWPENVIAGNGAAELLDVVFRLLHPKRVLLVEPAFLEYRRFLNLQGAEIRSVLLREKESFRFLFSELVNALQGIDLLVLGHPNNPTGTHLEKEELQALLQETKRRDIFVVLDEAFADWCPEISMSRTVRDDSSFFVVRSLTKFYALPGIRIGYGLGPRKLIEKLATFQVPWSCNRLAQKLGIAALQDSRFEVESRNWLLEERPWLEARLGEIPGMKVYPSSANFLLIRFGGTTGEKDRDGSQREPSLSLTLGKRGIYVRDLSEFPGLGSGFFRVAVRRREENQRLIEGIRLLLRASDSAVIARQRGSSLCEEPRPSSGGATKQSTSSEIASATSWPRNDEPGDPSPPSAAQDDGRRGSSG